MIGRFFGFLWDLAKLAPGTGFGLRFGSGASVLLSFLFLVFFVLGLALVLLGFDLDQVNLWLDRQAWWLEIVGTVVFKIFLAGILGICALIVASPIIDRRKPEPTKKQRRAVETGDNRPGGCMILIALAIGYFCFVGIFLD